MFLEELNQIAERIEGLQALALVGSDGLPVDSVSHIEDLDLEMLCAEMIALLRTMTTNDSELGAGPVQQLLVETDQHVMVTSIVAPRLLSSGRGWRGIRRWTRSLRTAPCSSRSG